MVSDDAQIVAGDLADGVFAGGKRIA